MKRNGEDVIILAAGEPDFDTPDIIKEAAIEAIRSGKTKYTPSRGTVSLRKAVCRKFKRDNHLEYEPGNIVVSNGAKHSIYNTLQVICRPGDEVILLSPFWVSYPEMVKMAGGVPVVTELAPETGFKAGINEIEKALSENTRALILNSPSNPAGVIYDKDELRDIAELCISKGILVISDEIYEKITFNGKEHVSIASVSERSKENTVVINGVSKSHSMTGWRIGYLAAEKDIAERVSTLQSHSTSNPCSISQAAAERALHDDLEDTIEANREKFLARRDLVISRLMGETTLKPFTPSGAFYIFCDISSTGFGSMEFAKRLLEEEKVAVIPGGPFGHDDHIRLSFASEEDILNRGLDRIVSWTRKAAGKSE
jgi:aspartate aminotransferase